MATKRQGAFEGSSMGSFVRAGFGLGIGSILAMMLFMIVAVALFIPGFIMVKREQRKKKDGKEQNKTNLVVGYVLMGLGMIVGLGFGAGIFFSMLGGEF